jgi:salicylate hydroxylase
MAQGACMAIEDGAVLARALEGAGSVGEGLALYQRNRVDRTARVVLESTEHGGLYHMTDAAQMREAFAKRNIAKERAEWLFNYDPLTVPLN